MRLIPIKTHCFLYHCSCPAPLLLVHPKVIIYWYCIQHCLNLRSNPSLMRFAHQNWVHSHLPSIMINLSWFFILFFCFWDVVQTANMRWRSPTEEFFLQLYCCCFCILCPNKDILLLWSSRFQMPFVFPQMQKRQRESTSNSHL